MLNDIGVFKSFSEPQEISPANVIAIHIKTETKLSRVVTAAADFVSPDSEVFDLPADMWCARLLQAILECLHGERQPSQLRQVVAAPVLQSLLQRRNINTQKNLRKSPVVRSIKYWNQTAESVEASAICEINTRYFPIAFKIQKQANTWVVLACEIGPY
jgi:hypothetical protein